MTELHELYTPSPVQEEVHLCQASEILFAGAAGPGKTKLLKWDAVVTQMLGEHGRYLEYRRRGITWQSSGWALHLRREYPMLTQTISDVKDFLPKLDPGARWSEAEKLFTCTCGYKFQFGHVQLDDDWRRYDSQDYTWLGLDEAVQFTELQYTMLRSRVRSSDPILRKKLRILLATNPDAPAEGLWVKKRFVDPCPTGRKLLTESVILRTGEEQKKTRIFIPARLDDNPDKEFVAQYDATLLTLPSHIRKARREGRWDAVAGAFFEFEFIPEVHVVKPFKIPDHWPKGRSMDWGYKVACPILWWAIDEEGNIVVYREVTFNHNVKESNRKDAELIAIEIKKIEKANGEWNDLRNCSKLTGPADYQIKERRGGIGPTMEETMARYGVYWQPCRKGRVAACAEFIRRLKDIPKSKNSRPGIVFFDTCVHTIRTIPLIKTSETNREEPEDGGEDHWLDAVLYACMYRGAAASAKKKDDDDVENELELYRKNRTSKWGYGL